MRFALSLAATFSGVLITFLTAIERFTPAISLLALAGGWYAFRLKRLEYLGAKRREPHP